MRQPLSEQGPISLYFLDGDISAAFSELLHSLGFQTETLQSLQELLSAERVVTEPLFYDSLSTPQKERCLLVGNCATPEAFCCPVIRQPLTPAKVHTALQDFLGVNIDQ